MGPSSEDRQMEIFAYILIIISITMLLDFIIEMIFWSKRNKRFEEHMKRLLEEQEDEKRRTF